MRNQDIVRDIADRPGALFGPADSRAAFVNLHASSILPKKSGQPANGLPVAPPLKNMAELKIHVDGLPLVLVFPMEEVVPSKRPGVQSDRADIHSLVSSTLEKIVDRLRGSDRQGAVLPSKPTLKVVEKDLETATVAVPHAPETVLRVGPLELNLIDRTAKRGDRTIDLRPREFRLLRYMMERGEKLLTRAKLLQEVWNYKFVPQTNLVDVHMGRLRRKIDGANEPAMIRSIRGAGFVLSANPLSHN